MKKVDNKQFMIGVRVRFSDERVYRTAKFFRKLHGVIVEVRHVNAIFTSYDLFKVRDDYGVYHWVNGMYVEVLK